VVTVASFEELTSALGSNQEQQQRQQQQQQQRSQHDFSPLLLDYFVVKQCSARLYDLIVAMHLLGRLSHIVYIGR
jgi:hypothetical protein